MFGSPCGSLFFPFIGHFIPFEVLSAMPKADNKTQSKDRGCDDSRRESPTQTRVALAGALQEQDLPLVRDLGADVVGVRSAACQDCRRAGPLDVEQVRRLRKIIAQRLPDAVL